MDPLPQPQPSELPPLPGAEPTLGQVMGPQRSPAVLPDQNQAAAPSAQPDQSQEPTLGQAFSGMQAQPPPQQQMASTGGVQSPQQQQQNQDDQKDQDIQAAIAKLSADFKGSGPGKAAQKAQDEEDTKAAIDALKESVSSGQGLTYNERFYKSAGRDINEEANALNKLFAEDGGGGKIIGGKLYFRRTSDGKYQPAQGDPSIMESIRHLGDFGGDAIQVATEATVGAASTALALGTAGMAAPASVLGVAGAPIAGTAARDWLVKKLGINSEDHSTIADGMMNLGANVLTHGLIKTIPPSYNFLTKTLPESFNEANPVNRLGQMREVIHAIDNVTSEYGYTGAKAAGKVLSPGETGEAISSLLDRSKEKLARAVNMVDQKATELAGDTPLPSTNMLGKMKEILQREGAIYDAKTGLFKEGVEDARSRVAFGDANGQRFIDGMIKDHNYFAAQERAQGGATMGEFLNRTRKYQSMADWGDGPKQSPQLNQALEEVSGASAIDRDNAFSQVLKGTPEEKIYANSYQDFSQNIGVITDMRKAISGKESGELIVNSLIKNNNPDRLAKIKSIVGEDSQEWASLRANTVLKLLDDAKDPSGIFVASKFNDSLKKLGQPFLNELGDPEAIKRLQLISKKASQIYLSDTLTPSLRTDVEDFAKAGLSVASNRPLSLASSFFRMFRGNVLAMNYLNNDVFMKMASEAGSNAERNIIMEMADASKKISDSSKVVTHKGIQYYVPVVTDTLKSQVIAKGAKSLFNDYVNREQNEPAPMPTLDQGTQGTSGLGP